MPFFVHHLDLALESVMKLDHLAALGLTLLVVTRESHGSWARGRCSTHGRISNSLDGCHRAGRSCLRYSPLDLGTASGILLTHPDFNYL